MSTNSVKNEFVYKTILSGAFGLLGFVANFYTIIFPFGEYTVAVLFGLIFPLLIALSWGWRFGLLSAVVGGAQTMWWLWGPSNGYAVFFVVPPFTLWIVWHGIFAEMRSRRKTPKWWLNMYVVEIPFRVLCTVNLLTLSRLAISLNPPPWSWAADATRVVPMHFSVFVAVKQAVVAFILLLFADVLLSIGWVRQAFRLKQKINSRETGYILSTFLLLGCLFWIIDSLLHAYAFGQERTFIESLALDIPHSNIYTRIVVFFFCAGSGLITAKIMRSRKEGVIALSRSEKDAKASAGLLRSLIRSIPDLVWLKNKEGVYLFCNSRFERFFGAKESDIIGKTDYDFIDKETADFFRMHDQNAMGRGSPSINEEEVVYADDGHREMLETIKTPLYDNDGRLTGVLGIGRNISDRLHLQAQLIQAQKMESVGRLAGGVAHDFNNMLSIIIGNIEIALQDLDPAHPVSANLREVEKAAQRSSGLTRQLLAFARKQMISPRVLDLNQVLEGMLKMLRRLIGEDIELSWCPGKNIWRVKIDPTQIDQSLANLCLNARDSITDTGKIIIETRNTQFDKDYCREHAGFRPGDYVCVAVSDNGCGMDQETIDNLFEPFFTTKKQGEGTGLGLATVYGIVKQNNGFINVYSEPGEGTTIKIYLPRYSGGIGSGERENADQAVFHGHETILLVEDEAAILAVTEKMLKRLGYTVFAAAGPEEALRLAGGFEPGEVDLLMTDVIMPVMNGRDLARELQGRFASLKCLYMSGYTANVIAHHGVLDEGLHFINKPFSTLELSLKLREVLSEDVSSTKQ